MVGDRRKATSTSGPGRALAVHAPATAEVAEALAGGGGPRWKVRTAADRGSVTDGLRTPLDLVVVWEGVAEPRAAEIVALCRSSPLRPAVVAVVEPDRLSDGVELVQAGAVDYVATDRLRRLAVVGRRILEERELHLFPDLARTACHELNNLLAPVPLAAGILRQELEGESLRMVDDVEVAAARATRVVDSLYRTALWCERPEGQGGVPVEVSEIVQIAARRLRAADPGLLVETDHPASRLAVEVASPRPLLQALLCLSMAAAKELGDGDYLGLEAEADPPGRVRVTVSWRPSPGSPPDRLPPEVEATVERLGGSLESGREADGTLHHRLLLPAARS